MAYRFRAYCDICGATSFWVVRPGNARLWRYNHFETVHRDNPMHKENCRIQRYPVADID